MKQKDVLLVAVIVIISGVISILISNALFSRKTAPSKVEVVEVISADFPPPSEKYFNTDSINPTQRIKIGDKPNKAPFKKTEE